MWIFTNKAFLSIVDPAQRGGPSPDLLVRARFDGDIEAVFPSANVQQIPNRDYAYRALLPRELVIAKIAQEVGDIDYHNFKGSVPDMERHDVYMGVWQVMYRAQGRLKRVGEWLRPQRADVNKRQRDFGFDHSPDSPAPKRRAR